MSVTRGLARYVTGASLEDFPPQAVQAAKGGILDCVGCALAGSREPLADILCDFLRETDGVPAATVVGRGMKASLPGAALANGAMAHALDYDDITRGIKGHPSVVLLPPALALGEHLDAPGRDVLLAYMVGFEVASAVGGAMSVAYGDDLGWHPTGPLGAIGAAAVAARLLGLDEERTAMALSLAASQASGLRENFGTMTKPFHAGHAARGGVVAALLVQRGFTASATGLEGGYDAGRILAGLGKHLALCSPGIEVKKYPCCGSTHQALDALFALLREAPVDPAQVEEVEVVVDFDPPRSLIHQDPHTALQGKFSMQYCVAAALVDGRIGLGTFTDAMVERPPVRALIPRVRMRRTPGYEGQPSWVEASTEVRVRLKDGQVRQRRVHRDTSGPLRGVTGEDLRAKFLDCAARALEPPAAQDALRDLERLEELDGTRRLMDLLRGDGKR